MDTHTLRLTIFAITSIAILSIIACAVLSVIHADHSTGLCQLAATCAGVLAGLAVPRHSSPSPEPSPPSPAI